MGWELKHYPEYWVGTKLAYPHVAPEAPKFARSEVVGNLVFVSGATGHDTLTDKPTPKSFEEQMVSALDKVKTAMEETRQFHGQHHKDPYASQEPGRLPPNAQDRTGVLLKACSLPGGESAGQYLYAGRFPDQTRVPGGNGRHRRYF